MTASVFDRIAEPYDVSMLPLELVILRRLRRRMIPALSGRVLEIGVGTGVNLPYYATNVQLVATELSIPMLRRARRRRIRAHASWVVADAQAMPFGDGCFDHVAGSLVFCSIENPGSAAREMYRILRPGGGLSLLEHTRGSAGIARRITDALAEPWYRFTGSCHLDRETDRILTDAGFTVTKMSTYWGGAVRLIYAGRQVGG